MNATSMRGTMWVLVLAASAALAQSPSQVVAGEVKEKIDASVYTYLRIATPGGDVWAAVPTAAVKPGDKVQVLVQTVMPNFESKTLSRTFDRLAFGTLGGQGAPQPAAPTAAPAHPALSTTTVTGAPLLVARQPRANAPAPAPAPAMTSALEGEVLEAIDVPMYTYLRLKTSEGEQWAAVPSATVKSGARVKVLNPMRMENFESKVLKRRFDQIIFGSLGG